VLSKDQANATAMALLSGAVAKGERVASRRTWLMTFMYTELRNFPATSRVRVLREASLEALRGFWFQSGVALGLAALLAINWETSRSGFATVGIPALSIAFTSIVTGIRFRRVRAQAEDGRQIRALLSDFPSTRDSTNGSLKVEG
jgi:hypothetical protein